MINAISKLRPFYKPLAPMKLGTTTLKLTPPLYTPTRKVITQSDTATPQTSHPPIDAHIMTTINSKQVYTTSDMSTAKTIQSQMGITSSEIVSVLELAKQHGSIFDYYDDWQQKAVWIPVNTSKLPVNEEPIIDCYTSFSAHIDTQNQVQIDKGRSCIERHSQLTDRPIEIQDFIKKNLVFMTKAGMIPPNKWNTYSSFFRFYQFQAGESGKTSEVPHQDDTKATIFTTLSSKGVDYANEFFPRSGETHSVKRGLFCAFTHDCPHNFTMTASKRGGQRVIFNLSLRE